MASSGVVQFIRSRLSANTSYFIGKAVAYAAAFFAVVFCLAALFVWIAQTESLIVACLIFAGLFAAAAVVAAVMAWVYRRRAETLRQNSALTTLNPAMALAGWRTLRTLQRRAPMATLAAAAVIGVVVVLFSARRSGEGR